jgi:hypothetical protein
MMPNPTSAQERRVAGALKVYHNQVAAPMILDLTARLEAADPERVRLRLRTKPWWQRAWTALRRAA